MKICLLSNLGMGSLEEKLLRAKFQQDLLTLKEYKETEDPKKAEILLIKDNTTISLENLNPETHVIITDWKNIYENLKETLQKGKRESLKKVISENLLSKEEKNTNRLKVVAVTACPTGVAHTFMAAEALEEKAKERGWKIKVETRGSIGTKNQLSKEEIEEADLVIIAADIELDLSSFNGKKIYKTSTGLALKKTNQELDKALKESFIFKGNSDNNSETKEPPSQGFKGIYKHLLTGVSFMLPMVVAGGLLIALSFAIGGTNQEGILAEALALIGGGVALKLMVPLLAGYIAFSIADRPALVPGLIGGFLCNEIGAGFLGGIVVGYLAGYTVKFLIKSIPLPSSLEALKPILILPFLSSLIVGLAMIFVIGPPVAYLMIGLEEWLKGLSGANAALLGALLGAMMCSDFGGPINKSAYAFGVGLLASQEYAPMAAIMAGGMVPPLAMGIASWVDRALKSKKFNQTEKEAANISFILGLCFISEGAIPFAAKDPAKVIPISMIGGAITGALTMLFGNLLMTPHGGIFVLLIPGALSKASLYFLAIIIGSLTSAFLYYFIKKPTTEN